MIEGWPWIIKPVRTLPGTAAICAKQTTLAPASNDHLPREAEGAEPSKALSPKHVRIKGQAVAMIGEWLLPRFNFLLGSGRQRGVGAILLSLLLRSVGASGWGAGR